MSYTLTEKAHIAFVRAIPAPTSEAPPGSTVFLKVLNWIFWGGLVVCVIGFIAAGAAMIFEHRQGSGGGENMKKLGSVLVGSVIIGSASAFAAAATGQ